MPGSFLISDQLSVWMLPPHLRWKAPDLGNINLCGECVKINEIKKIENVSGKPTLISNNTITDGGVAPQCTFARPT